MSGLDRRQLLAGLLTPALGGGTGLGALLIPAGPASASYVVAAITIATVLIQQIAAKERGDGGLGASLSAINGKLDIAIAQLASIQASLQYITEQIAKIKADLADALAEQQALSLRNTVISRIEKIKDIQRAASAKKIDLAQGKIPQPFLENLSATYRDFDNARRELWNSPKGSSTIASTVCSACAAVDTLAFGYGLISDAELSILFERHLTWLARMLSKDDPDSVETAILKAEAEENTVVAEAKKNSEIAFQLYSAPTVELCVRVTTNVEGANIPPFGPTALGDMRTLLAATYTRSETVVQGGAITLGNIKNVDRSVAFYREGGIQTFKSGPKPRAIDASCPDDSRPQLTLNRTQAEDYQHRRGVDAPVWNDALRGARWTYLKEPSSLAAAQIYFDAINNARIKREFARACKTLVQVNHADVAGLRQILPSVPLGDKP